MDTKVDLLSESHRPRQGGGPAAIDRPSQTSASTDRATGGRRLVRRQQSRQLVVPVLHDDHRRRRVGVGPLDYEEATVGRHIHEAEVQVQVAVFLREPVLEQLARRLDAKPDARGARADIILSPFS